MCKKRLFSRVFETDAFMFTGNQKEERIDDKRREDVFIRKLRIRRVQWNGRICDLQEFSVHPFKVVKVSPSA